MEQRETNELVGIDDWIRSLPVKPSSWPRIFQVPHYLRKVNEEAYEPIIISIGPYHRQNDHLKAMETHKVRFLKDLQRRNGESAQGYVKFLTDTMERARNCYSEPLSISCEEFLKMMVLDGCFIVELIHKIREKSRMQDPILKVDQIYYNILKDLRLVENQLPFFVLRDQFPAIDDFNHLFKDVPGINNCRTSCGNSIGNVKHLVDLFRTNWRPPEDFKSVSVPVQGKKEDSKSDECLLIPSATELREAGIKFKGVEGNLFDIKFKNGTLYIPTLTIHDGTEKLYRNVIACEQFDDNHNSPQYFTEYRKVLDCLINTGKDVELLCRKGIIQNWLGTNEEVAKMINSLGTEVLIHTRNFFYAKLFEEVNKHYKKPCNKRMANLRHNYFNSPWALFSVLAASFLLFCTLLQTTFTIFPRS